MKDEAWEFLTVLVIFVVGGMLVALGHQEFQAPLVGLMVVITTNGVRSTLQRKQAKKSKLELPPHHK